MNTQQVDEKAIFNAARRERPRQQGVEAIDKLYEAWDAAEPDKGHAAKIDEWQKKLSRLLKPDSAAVQPESTTTPPKLQDPTNSPPAEEN